MYVAVSLDVHDAPVALREPDDFTAFSVQVDGNGDWDALARALDGTAHVDPPHVWVALDALGALGRGDDAQWLEQLDGMVAYARSKEWVDEHGCVRAHCEWVAGEPRA